MLCVLCILGNKLLSMPLAGSYVAAVHRSALCTHMVCVLYMLRTTPTPLRLQEVVDQLARWCMLRVLCMLRMDHFGCLS